MTESYSKMMTFMQSWMNDAQNYGHMTTAFFMRIRYKQIEESICKSPATTKGEALVVSWSHGLLHALNPWFFLLRLNFWFSWQEVSRYRVCFLWFSLCLHVCVVIFLRWRSNPALCLRIFFVICLSWSSLSDSRLAFFCMSKLYKSRWTWLACSRQMEGSMLAPGSRCCLTILSRNCWDQPREQRFLWTGNFRCSRLELQQEEW